MDWIERLIGVSPDGGSGLMEAAIFAAMLALAAFALMRRRGRMWQERHAARRA